MLQLAAELQCVLVDAGSHFFLEQLIAVISKGQKNKGRIQYLEVDAREEGQNILLVKG